MHIRNTILYLHEDAPILRCNKCCILGPSAPNKWGGKPLASSKACNLPTSLSSLSLSLSVPPPVVPVPVPVPAPLGPTI